jgi:hypothetical protein
VEDAGVEQRELTQDLTAVPQLEDLAGGQQLDLDLPGWLAGGFGADGDLADPSLDVLPVRADADQVVEDAVAAGWSIRISSSSTNRPRISSTSRSGSAAGGNVSR